MAKLEHVRHEILTVSQSTNFVTVLQCSAQHFFINDMTKEGSTKIIDFMIPRAQVIVLGYQYGHIGNILKMHFIF